MRALLPLHVPALGDANSKDGSAAPTLHVPRLVGYKAEWTRLRSAQQAADRLTVGERALACVDSIHEAGTLPVDALRSRAASR